MSVFGVSILIQKEGKILGVARRDNPNEWGLVGGKREKNETAAEAAVRECKEETGLTISNLEEIYRRYTDHGDTVTFSCDWSGEPSSQAGEPECKWLDPEDLMVGIFGTYNTNLFKKMGIIT